MVPDGLASISFSRNFFYRPLNLLNIVYLLLPLYIAAYSVASFFMREIMYQILCLSAAPAALAMFLSTCNRNIFAFKFPLQNGSRWATLSVMLSAPASAHPEGPAVMLAIGFDCYFEGVLSTIILSCAVKCRILDATSAYLSSLKHVCFEGSEELSNFFFLKFSSDSISSFPLGSLNSPKVMLLYSGLITCKPVIFIAKYFPTSYFL